MSINVNKPVKEVAYNGTPLILAGGGSGGGSGLPEEALLITGDCQYRFAQGGWDWFLREYGNQIQTQDVTYVGHMFEGSQVESIPFEINISTNQAEVMTNNMFSNCFYLTAIPKINNLAITEPTQMFSSCNRLRYLPEDIADWFDWTYVLNNPWASKQAMCYGCFSLRSIPMDLYKYAHPEVETWASYFQMGFADCFALDELVNLPIPYNKEWMDNAFYYFCNYCYRLKNLTFATDNGAPYVRNWGNQTIEMQHCMGWSNNRDGILLFNSGITADKEVTDDASYQALKNDPDWFTCDAAYSRYNKTSAVATINSLPDTSAYVAANGCPNTIIFLGESGSRTDGGAINTMTEDEIAVAAAKGWSVALV